MKKVLILAALAAVVVAKPELYKEQEDFQYSRSSSDDGSKSGYYGAQRGNMGGNYERSHNMDSLAQNQMSGLVRQVDGELGDGAKTRAGSVYTAANSKGTYGSGHFDLSNLAGRNFHEGTYYDNSQSSSSQSRSSSAHNSADYSSSNSQSYRGSSGSSYRGYQREGQAQSQFDDRQSVDNLQANSGYHNHGSESRHSSGFQSQAGFQEQGEYDQNNRNSHSRYGSNIRLISATPVKIVLTPGGRVAIPVAAQTYDVAHGSSAFDQNIRNSAAVSDENLNNPSDAKQYQSSYRYHKKWEKHDTIPTSIIATIPTQGSIPSNSELLEDGEAQTQYNTRGSDSQRGVKSSSSQSRHQSYYNNQHQTDSSSSASNAFSQAGYNAGVNHVTSSDSNINAYDQKGYNTGSYSDLNNLVEDLNKRPKSYQSSYSYHKSWERQGDPYVIKPASSGYYDNRQASQRLTSSSRNQGYTNYQSGSRYNQNQEDCDENSHIRIARSSYTSSQDMQQQVSNDDDRDELVQQVQSPWQNLGHLSQQSESMWGQQNLGDLNQQSQSIWEQQNLGQEPQGRLDNLEDFNQQSQSKFEDFNQQTQSKFEDFNQQSQSKFEDFNQQSQSKLDNLEDFSQQSQSKLDNLEDFNQQSQGKLDNLEILNQQSQSKLDNLEKFHQQDQNNWDLLNVGQQSQNKWDQLDSFSQQSVNLDQSNVEQQSQNKWNNLENSGDQSQNYWNQQAVGQEDQNKWDNFEELGQKSQNWEQQNSDQQWNKFDDMTQQLQNSDNQKYAQNNQGKQQNKETEYIQKELNKTDTGFYRKEYEDKSSHNVESPWDMFDSIEIKKKNQSKSEQNIETGEFYWNKFNANGDTTSQSDSHDAKIISLWDKLDKIEKESSHFINLHNSSLWHKNSENFKNESHQIDTFISNENQEVSHSTYHRSKSSEDQTTPQRVIQPVLPKVYEDVPSDIEIQKETSKPEALETPSDIGRGDISTDDLYGPDKNPLTILDDRNSPKNNHVAILDNSTSISTNKQTDHLSSKDESYVMQTDTSLHSEVNETKSSHKEFDEQEINQQHLKLENRDTKYQGMPNLGQEVILQSTERNFQNPRQGTIQDPTHQHENNHYVDNFMKDNRENYEHYFHNFDQDSVQKNDNDVATQNSYNFEQQNINNLGQQYKKLEQQNLNNFQPENIEQIEQKSQNSEQNLHGFVQENTQDFVNQNQNFEQQYSGNLEQDNVQDFWKPNSLQNFEQNIPEFVQQNENIEQQNSGNLEQENVQDFSKPYTLQHFEQENTQDFVQQNENMEQESIQIVQKNKKFKSPSSHSFEQENKQDFIQHNVNSEQSNSGKLEQQNVQGISQKNTQDFIEQKDKIDQENLQKNITDSLLVETPVEAQTEKPGFWKSLGSKISNAKNKVASWFKS